MQNHQKFSWEAFNQAPVVGILRGVDQATLDHVVPLYAEVGFSTLEITMNTEGAAKIIAALRSQYPHLNVGAGTVCNIDQLNEALEAGAQFIVTPIIDKQVIERCKELGIPSFVGALTPTEIYQAWSYGATVVKVFPCSQFSAGYLKDVMAPLNHIKLLPTGGVSKENVSEFLSVGAVGAGMGGSLFPKNLMAVDQKEALKAHLEELYGQVHPL